MLGEVYLAGSSIAILMTGSFALGRNWQAVRDAFAGRPISAGQCRDDCPHHGDRMTAWARMMKRTVHARSYRTTELLEDFRAFAPDAAAFTPRDFEHALRAHGFELKLRSGGVRAWTVPSIRKLFEAA
jgi:hypothetical protein